MAKARAAVTGISHKRALFFMKTLRNWNRLVAESTLGMTYTRSSLFDPETFATKACDKHELVGQLGQTAMRRIPRLPSNTVFCRAARMAVESVHPDRGIPCAAPESSMAEPSFETPPAEKRLDSCKKSRLILTAMSPPSNAGKSGKAFQSNRHLHDKRSPFTRYPKNLMDDAAVDSRRASPKSNPRPNHDLLRSRIDVTGSITTPL
jgi:hypothetical protein